jgi:hypothetical protein
MGVREKTGRNALTGSADRVTIYLFTLQSWRLQ